MTTASRSASEARVLVAGIGNIFLGDDGFGVEVARRLAGASLPPWVTVADYGTSGMHLAYDLAGYGTAILVDAAPRGERPGTVTVLEVEPGGHQPGGHQPGRHQPGPAAGASGGSLDASRFFDAHGMQPDVVLGVLAMLGTTGKRILVVGCEPASIGYRMGLSEPVAAAVDEAVRIITELAAGVPAARGDREGMSHVPWHSR
jgi:hydrogenase maturation protease